MDFEIKYHENVILIGFAIARKKGSLDEKIELIRSELLETWNECDTFKASEIDSAYNFFSHLFKDEKLFVRRFSIASIMSSKCTFRSHHHSFYNEI